MRKHTSQYDKDFYKWGLSQANFLKLGQFDKIDIENIAEEIESLSKSQRSSLRNHLVNLLLHMLKVLMQPEKHTRSWELSILNAREKIEDILADSPSLKPEIKTMLDRAYERSVTKASLQTGIAVKKFPKECPWAFKEILK